MYVSKVTTIILNYTPILKAKLFEASFIMSGPGPLNYEVGSRSRSFWKKMSEAGAFESKSGAGAFERKRSGAGAFES